MKLLVTQPMHSFAMTRFIQRSMLSFFAVLFLMGLSSLTTVAAQAPEVPSETSSPEASTTEASPTADDTIATMPSEAVSPPVEPAPPPVPEIPPPYGSRDERDRTLLANALPDEAQWLDGELGKVFALYRPTESRQTQGALAIFHAIDDPQRWPLTLRTLQERLPKSGWEILSVALPRERGPAIPARDGDSTSAATSSTAATEETSTTEKTSTTDAATLIASYLRAATEFLVDKSHQRLIVMTDNASALHTMAYFHTDALAQESLEGLILIHLQSQQPLRISELEQLFSNPDLPVFDIFFGRDADVAARRERHKGVALRKKLTTYHQLTIDEADPVLRAQGRNFFMGRIQGFMDRHRAPLSQRDKSR